MKKVEAYIFKPPILRQFHLVGESLKKVVDYSAISVFDKISVYPIILLIESKKDFSKEIDLLRVNEGGDSDYFRSKIETKHLENIPHNIWGPLLTQHLELISKIYSQSSLLENVAKVQATSTAAEADNYSRHIYEKEDSRGMEVVNTGIIDPFCTKYGIEKMTNKRQQYANPVLDTSCVKANRLAQYRTPKIIIAKIAKRIEAFLDKEGRFASLNTNCVNEPTHDYCLEYLLGLLNSNLMHFIYSCMFAGLRMSGGYFQFQAPQLRLVPVVDSNNDKKSKLIEQVNEIIDLNEKSLLSQIPQEKETLNRQIKVTYTKINQLVYQLYSLTEDEIKIVEEEVG